MINLRLCLCFIDGKRYFEIKSHKVFWEKVGQALKLWVRLSIFFLKVPSNHAHWEKNISVNEINFNLHYFFDDYVFLWIEISSTLHFCEHCLNNWKLLSIRKVSERRAIAKKLQHDLWTKIQRIRRKIAILSIRLWILFESSINFINLENIIAKNYRKDSICRFHQQKFSLSFWIDIS